MGLLSDLGLHRSAIDPRFPRTPSGLSQGASSCYQQHIMAPKKAAPPKGLAPSLSPEVGIRA